MKELKSTDLLDQQIHLEAVKKIQDILKNADEECEKISSSVNEQIQIAKKQKEEFYKKKLEDEQKKLEAKYPLERQRLKLSYMENRLIEGINNYLETLKEEQRLSIVLKKLENDEEVKALIAQKDFNAYIYGFDFEKAKSEIEKLLGKKLKKVEKTEYDKMIIEEELALQKQQGLILEAVDNSVRFRLTLNCVISSMLDEKRNQLTTSLFGEEQ